MIGNGAFCNKNSPALLNLLNSEVDVGMFFQMMVWYLQLNDPKLFPCSCSFAAQKWVLLLLIPFFFPKALRNLHFSVLVICFII